MSRLVILDEIHLTLLVPSGLPDVETQVMWQAIIDPNFDADLRRAVRRLVRRRPVLKRLRVRVSR
jgi:hypothetical protein